jgi:hypothetical protein
MLKTTLLKKMLLDPEGDRPEQTNRASYADIIIVNGGPLIRYRDIVEYGKHEDSDAGG